MHAIYNPLSAKCVYVFYKYLMISIIILFLCIYAVILDTYVTNYAQMETVQS